MGLNDPECLWCVLLCCFDTLLTLNYRNTFLHDYLRYCSSTNMLDDLANMFLALSTDQTGKRLTLGLISPCEMVTFLPKCCSQVQQCLTEGSQCPERTGHTVRDIIQCYPLSGWVFRQTRVTVTMFLNACDTMRTSRQKITQHVLKDTPPLWSRCEDIQSCLIKP